MKQISASIMCSKNLLNLESEIKKLEELNIDMLHLDAMDGHFVNNITFGPDMLNEIHKFTKLPCDYHIMTNRPLAFIERLDLRENDIVTIHAELNEEILDNTIWYLKNELGKRGVKIGLALNPKTAIEGIVKYLDYIDIILIMLINPGFAGQPIIDGIINKPIYVKHYLKNLGYENIKVSVDGGISLERAKQLAACDIDIFVGGTSGLFMKNTDLEISAKLLRETLNQFK